MRRRRHEFATVGFDDFGATLGGIRTGLRVPAFVPAQPYLFLLAVCDLAPGDYLRGINQAAEIGAFTPAGPDGTSPPFYAYPIPISGFWHFPDGFIVWTVTIENVPPSHPRTGPFDQASFVLEDAGSPALVYETAHFPVAPTAPGYLGLDGYTPPVMRGDPILTMRDIRFPFAENIHEALGERVHTNKRVRFYAQVTQSNPQTRIMPPHSITGTDAAAVSTSFTREDLFWSIFPGTAQYFSVAGRIIIDDAHVPRPRSGFEVEGARRAEGDVAEEAFRLAIDEARDETRKDGG